MEDIVNLDGPIRRYVALDADKDAPPLRELYVVCVSEFTSMITAGIIGSSSSYFNECLNVSDTQPGSLEYACAKWSQHTNGLIGKRVFDRFPHSILKCFQIDILIRESLYSFRRTRMPIVATYC